jgi:hypothetical protein
LNRRLQLDPGVAAVLLLRGCPEDAIDEVFRRICDVSRPRTWAEMRSTLDQVITDVMKAGQG